jgi:hypothetical protein
VHDGDRAAVGFSGIDQVIDCASTEFGLRSYAKAGSVLAMGKVPVVWSMGRSLVLMMRLPFDRVTE